MIIRRNNNFNFCKPFWRKYFINKSKLRINESIRNTFIREKSLLTGFSSIFVLILFILFMSDLLRSLSIFNIINSCLRLLLSLFMLLNSCFNSFISYLKILILCWRSLTVSSLNFFLLNFSKVSSKFIVDFGFLPISTLIKFFLNLSKYSFCSSGF